MTHLKTNPIDSSSVNAQVSECGYDVGIGSAAAGGDDTGE
ncbi:hypothetical protein FHT16_000404 [Xanthomonas arboricola]